MNKLIILTICLVLTTFNAQSHHSLELPNEKQEAAPKSKGLLGEGGNPFNYS